MKRFSILIVMTAAIVCSGNAQTEQRVQLVPDAVSQINLSGRQSLRIVAGSETRLETKSNLDNIARVRGDKMIISSDSAGITLSIAPKRNIKVSTEDYANVVFEGAFPMRSELEVHAEDFSTVTFVGSASDTVRSTNLILHAEDYAHIGSGSIMQAVQIDFSSEDFSRISLKGLDYIAGPNDTSIEQRSLVSDFGRIYTGRTTAGDMLLYTSEEEHDKTNMLGNMTDRVADAVRSSAGSEKQKNTVSWHFGGFILDFAWGWHNWGNEMFSGFAGVESPAEVGTTFNNIQLSGNYAIAHNRWLGFYVGLGLEWDKWKFVAPQVQFNTAAEPYAFANAGATSGSMLLTTRYVVVPFSIRIGDRDGVHLVLSAIPGIHWNASGLRTKQTIGNSTETVKDRSINRYINPYKFDIRAELYYSWFGIYAQFSTLSTFKGNSEELFPVKFGIIL